MNAVIGLTLLLSEASQIATESEHADLLSKLPKQPNIVILLADDLGYGDLASYGSPSQEWGGIDALAAGGVRFASAYAADSMCSPARGALLSGRLPVRLGLVGGRRVFLPYDTGGLPADVRTLPEALRDHGYATGMSGKWHLGINAVNSTDGTHLPSRHGFDYVGSNFPMSNLWECRESWTADRALGIELDKIGPDPLKCFLYKGDELVQQPIQFEGLTPTMVEEFKVFAQQNVEKKKPFFYYFSFPHVHSYQFADKAFLGKSQRGLFGDSLNEMHWAVDQIQSYIKELEIAEKTLVVFLSDHGPHAELCELGGSTGGLTGGKSNSWEGGFRIPFIASWPGVIPPGAYSQAVLSALDLFPTLTALAGAPQDGVDGISVPEILLAVKRDPQLALTLRRPIIFYCNKHLMAVRIRNFKIHYFTSPIFDDLNSCPHGMPLKDWFVQQRCEDSKLTAHDPPLVFHLGRDPAERFSLDAGDDDVAAVLGEAAEALARHKASLVPVPDQMGHFNPHTIPCANYPKCRLGYPFDARGDPVPTTKKVEL